jgi:hypothetical protein
MAWPFRKPNPVLHLLHPASVYTIEIALPWTCDDQ